MKLSSIPKKPVAVVAAAGLVVALGAGTAVAFTDDGSGWWSSSNDWLHHATTYSIDVDNVDPVNVTDSAIPSEGVSGTYGDDVSWTLGSDGSLVISGSGVLGPNDTYAEKYSPWNEYSDAITSAAIDAGITEIGTQPFRGLVNLQTVTFADDSELTEIGPYAFAGCTSLTGIVIPEGVLTIEVEAFENCSSLATVEFPESLNNICFRAFYGCASLTDVVLPEGLVELDQGVFEQCESLATVTVSKDTHLRYECFGYYAEPQFVKEQNWTYYYAIDLDVDGDGELDYEYDGQSSEATPQVSYYED